MIDHVSLRVSDFGRSKRFYEAALAPLGYKTLMEFPGPVAGLGADGKPDFWLAPGKTGESTHIAFATSQRAHVDAFYRAAIAAGGKDNGGPGLRREYHPTYYGAFVIDPDGNNVEAVCHLAE